MADRNEQNALDFALRMARRGEQIERSATRIQRGTALVGDRIIVLATPVDQGPARSNTIVSSGFPVFHTIPAYSPRPKGSGPGDAANAQGALDQAAKAIANHEPHATIYIQNNKSYFPMLDEGSSAQAPGGMSKQAMKGMRDYTRSQRLLEDK